MRCRRQRHALAALALSVASAAHADGGAPPAAPAAWLAAGFDTAAYRARERLADGRIGSTERGSLDGFWLSAGLPAWRWRASRHGGTVDYLGYSQAGLPIATFTQLVIRDQRLAWQPRWPLQPALVLQGDLAVGRRTIERDILPTPFTSRLGERLRVDYLRAGLQLGLALDPAATLHLGAGLEQGLRSRLQVDFHGFGSSPDLRPAGRGGAWLQAGLSLRLSPTLRAAASCHAQRQRYGASPAQPFRFASGETGSVSYPGSTQTLRGCGVSLGYAFGLRG